jgi:hypothetical protein
METQLIHGYNLVESMPYNRAMPLLRKEAEKVLSFKDLMQEIVKAHESKDYEKRDFLISAYKDTSTACPHYSNTFGVLHDNQDLLNINKETSLVDYAIPKTVQEYEQLMKENPEYFLKRDEKGVIIGRELSEDEALDSRVWSLLSGRNHELHKDFVKLIFELGKQKYSYDTMMRICLPDDRKNPELRDWYLRSLYNGSYADARDSLDYINVRLPGVCAQNLGSLLEKIAKEAGITNPEEVRKAIKLYKTTKELMQ